MSKSRCIGYAGGDVRTGFAGGPFEDLARTNGRREIPNAPVPHEPRWKEHIRLAQMERRIGVR